MVKVKKFIDENVYEEAKKRIHHVFDTFDTVVVMFSGGKDSLAALHMVREVQLERGMKDAKVNAVFRDEELIPSSVIDFVNHYRQLEWMNLLYFAVPLRSKKYVLGVVREYIQWDKNREHIRPIPAHAHVLEEGDDRIFDQYTMDEYTASFFKGKIAFITGVRAAESIIRYRASVNKINENYINACAVANVKLVKPLFDWQEDDIFKYFYEKNIKYCSLYDAQLYAGESLRVSTPLHAESAKKFYRLKTIDPLFYNQIITLFPEMIVQDRYYRELDLQAVRREYDQSLGTIRNWIEENIEDEIEYNLAMKRLNSVSERHIANPDSYPLRHILNAFMSGGYKREIIPATKSNKG